MDKYLLLCALTIATVGAVKDVRGQRIPNWLTYSGLLAALVVRAGLGGWTGLKGGLAGMLFAGGIFFLLFLLGGMGGGDVKLMAAVGAWVGLAQVGSFADYVGDRGRAAGGRLHAGSQAGCVRACAIWWNWCAIT